MNMEKAFMLLCCITTVTSHCILDRTKLMCFDEVSFDEYYTNVEILYLHNSYISAETFQRKLPNVDVVYVSGLHVSETCFELEDIVKIYGCHGKSLKQKVIVTL